MGISDGKNLKTTSLSYSQAATLQQKSISSNPISYLKQLCYRFLCLDHFGITFEIRNFMSYNTFISYVFLKNQKPNYCDLKTTRAFVNLFFLMFWAKKEGFNQKKAMLLLSCDVFIIIPVMLQQTEKKKRQ